MTTLWVTTLRSRDGIISIGDPSRNRITIRVQADSSWDSIRVEVPPEESVLAVKLRAMETFWPAADYHEDFAMKLGGVEVLDDEVSLSEAGVRDGSIVLIMHRRRRAIL